MLLLRHLPTPAELSEAQLRVWTRRAFRDEDKRAEHSERLVRRAVQGHPLLRELPTAVYAKGSYKNNTIGEWVSGTATTLATSSSVSLAIGGRFALVDKAGVVSAWTAGPVAPASERRWRPGSGGGTLPTLTFRGTPVRFRG